MGCQRVLVDALPPGETVQESFHVHLEPLPRDVRRARGFIREHAPVSLPASTADVLQLLTSELVTHAVLHARTEIELGLTVGASSLLVTVHDEDTTRGATDGATESAWGLGLVTSLAAASAVTEHPDGGRTAWFVLSRHDGGEPDAVG
jgi:two-component sensor histidine kinase